MEEQIKSAVEAKEKLWCLALLRCLTVDQIDSVLKEYIRLRDEGFTITIGGERELLPLGGKE